ncbi:MAG: hypothetical protein KAT09_06265 [Candidatus Aegiribacteria sp.]|nr:hypothetical protein [Candidatus Aegiribacteria sp.]
MKYALGLVVLVATLSFAGSDFSGGCAETFGISGFTKAWFYMYGTENHDPENTFRAYNWTSFTARLNDDVYGCVGTLFKSWSGNTQIQVCDAFLNMNIIPELSIKAGQFKIPFGWAFNSSGGGQYFLDRAAVTGTSDFNNFGGRDVGIKLHGQLDMVGIDVAYFNGTGTYTDADTSNNKEFAALLTVEPTDWLTLAGGVAMIGQPTHDVIIPAYMEISGDSVIVHPEVTVTVHEWSATGINAYALVDYPLSETADLIFQGEFFQTGYPGPDVIGYDEKAGMAFYGLFGVNIGLENSFLASIMPAVRYESLSPSNVLVDGADDPKDNTTVMDYSVNCHLTPKNTIQIGARNVSYEDEDAIGYTDMYLGWRMNF